MKKHTCNAIHERAKKQYKQYFVYNLSRHGRVPARRELTLLDFFPLSQLPMSTDPFARDTLAHVSHPSLSLASKLILALSINF